MTRDTNASKTLAAVVFTCMLALGWFSYSPALSGSFTLDDVSNLADLESVDDNVSAIRFMFSGIAGPLGRPLALASFLPQADAWPDDARSFLTVNILIHLLNAAILAAVLVRLSLACGIDQKNSLFAALAATALWMYMPLLASSSLMIVQRMTTLSATFVLLGLFAYLHARRGIDENPNKALIGMSLSLGIASVLAVLTKESGALLPTFILTLECTILRKPEGVQHRTWRNWSLVFLWLPTALILGYIATRVPYSPEMVLKKDFNAWERILTESRILWEYLAKALLPLPGQIGPFNENYVVARTLFAPGTMVALCTWAVASSLAITWRRRFPLVALGVLWYLSGHVIESTLLPLELYFDHRNYMPLVGPVFALSALALQLPTHYRKFAYAGLPLYALILCYSLFGLTSLWGSPATAARYWYDRSPDSVRAATELVGYQMADKGIDSGLDTLRNFVGGHPDHGYLLIQDLRISCLIDPETDHRSSVIALSKLVGMVRFTYTAGTMLSELSTAVREVDCHGVDAMAVRSIAEALLLNPRYQNDAIYNQYHHKLMASIYRHEENMPMTLEHLEKAKSILDSDDITMMIVTTLASDGEFDAARRMIDRALENKPLHPVKRFLRSNDLTELGDYVNTLENMAAQRDIP